MTTPVLFNTDTRGLIQVEDVEVKGHHGAYKVEHLDKTNTPYMLKPRWSDYKGGPKTELGLYQTQEYLIFVFKVGGEYIRYANTELNSSVHEDSCVEVFIRSDSKSYLNIEVNALGTIHAAEGEGRHNRVFKDQAWVDSNIHFYTTVNKKEGETHEDNNRQDWHCALNIKKSCLTSDASGEGLQELLSHVDMNAYKCGDLTKEPHFLTLFPIETAEPDFHRPEFFSKVTLG